MLLVDPLTKVAGVVGALGALAFSIVVIAFHWMRPEISPVLNYVSEYANGPWGPLLSVSAFVHGLGNIVVAAGFLLALSNSRWGRVGATIFGLSAVGVVIAAVYSTDSAGEPSTVSGQVHLLAAFSSFLMEALALCLLAIAFAQHKSWRSLVVPTAVSIGLGAASLAVLLVFRTTGWPPGIPERTALLFFVSWELLAALRLATVSSPSDNADDGKLIPRSKH